MLCFMPHEHCDHAPTHVSKKDTKKLYAIAGINAALAVFAFGMARHTGVGALDVESAHDVNDTIIATTRAESARRNVEHTSWYGVFRKTSYVAIAAFGAYAAVRSGVALLQVAPSLKPLNSSKEELFSSAVVAIGNQSTYAIARTLESQTFTTQDAERHAKTDRNASVMLAAGIAVGSVVPFVTELTGVVAGTYTAVHMGKHVQHIH
jgi:hypothetical protein